jgi:hypothetical protein
MNCPMGACPDDDLGLATCSLLREPHGDGGGWPLLSLESEGPEMVGAAREARVSKAALFLLEVGGAPVCCVNLAFSVAIAAAASGNIALMVVGSSPECLFVPGVVGGRAKEFLEPPSTLSLSIALLRRFDIGSRLTLVVQGWDLT